MPRMESDNPMIGVADASHGVEQPHHRDRTTPFWGRATPFTGSATPFWHRITPFTGSGNPILGSGNPIHGVGQPHFEVGQPHSLGRATPFWGRITPFTGSGNPILGSGNPIPWGPTTPNTARTGAIFTTGSARPVRVAVPGYLSNLCSNSIRFPNGSLTNMRS
jgi:hypothetical protein